MFFSPRFCMLLPLDGASLCFVLSPFFFADVLELWLGLGLGRGLGLELGLGLESGLGFGTGLGLGLGLGRTGPARGRGGAVHQLLGSGDGA